MDFCGGLGRLALSMIEEPKLRVIIVAVGGATCSGKTTLAKHLRNCLPDSFIIHQDDFAPPQERIPVHPEYGVQDWDDPTGAIDWPRLAAALECVRRTGALPPNHRSHDHLNEQRIIPVAEDVLARWRVESERIVRACEARGERVVWAIADGFLLYWSEDVAKHFDVRVFLRVPHDVLVQRRHERHGYHTAEGALWRDPPHYWEQIVYPAYVRAHKHLFEDGDVENGRLMNALQGIMLFEGQDADLAEIVDRVMKEVLDVTESVVDANPSQWNPS